MWGSYKSGGESVDAFLCSPARRDEDSPAILLIMEIWGVDEHIQDLARRYAEAGYMVVAPDLYSRGGKPAARSAERITELKAFLDKAPMSVIMDPEKRNEYVGKEEPEKAKRLIETMDSIFMNRDMDGMVDMLNDAVETMRNQYGLKSIGTVGYCMGGALSFRMAANVGVSASVVYYGTAPEDDELKNLKAPVLGLYGSEDHRISDAVPDVESRLKSLGKEYSHVIYKGAPHAFFNDTRTSYHYRSAVDAWGRTMEFFRSRLL